MADDLTRRVADELEIRNLIAKLAQLADDGALDEYIELFTQDSVWDGGAARVVKTGRGEILAAGEERRANGIAGPGSATRHVISTSTVELAGDRATARSLFRYYTKTDAAPQLSLMGVYDDEFTRTADGWRLARRSVRAGA